MGYMTDEIETAWRKAKRKILCHEGYGINGMGL